MPKNVNENRSFPIGTYKGLKFSIELYPYHNPEICVQGTATRLGSLARDAGPRAVLNAVERTVAGYEAEYDITRRDLGIARNQLRDYEARLGGTFGHEDYLKELKGLRDSLEGALSSTTGEQDTDGIVARIKVLRAAHTVEAAPEKTQRKAASMEEAVTTRIMRAREAEPERPQAEPEQIEIPVAPAQDKSAEIMQFKKPVERAKPRPSYRQKVEQEQRQMTLF